MSAFNCSLSPLVQAWDEARFYPAARRDLSVALYCLLVICGVCFPLVFWLAKKKLRYESLRSRKTALVVLVGLACLIHAHIGPGALVFGIATYPCWLRSLLAMLVLPFFCANIMIKLMTFFFMHQLSRGMTQISRVDDDAFQHGRNVPCSSLASVAYSLLAVLRGSRQDSIPQSRVISALSFVTSTYGLTFITLLFCGIAFLIALALMTSQPEVKHGCYGCALAFDEVVMLLVVSLLMLIFAALCTVRVWRFPDPWRIRREMFYTCVFALLGLVGFMGGTFFPSSPDSVFDHQLELCLGMLLLLAMQSVVQVWAAHRRQPKLLRKFFSKTTRTGMAVENKHSQHQQQQQSHLGTTMTVSEFNTAKQASSLSAIVQNEVLAKAFEEFLIAELSVESLMFIKDTNDWKRAYHSISSNARVARAKRLYRIYIAPGASFEINISSKCSRAVREVFTELSGEQEDVSVDVFDEAREEITALLQYGSLRRFLRSKEYQDLVGAHKVGNL